MGVVVDLITANLEINNHGVEFPRGYRAHHAGIDLYNRPQHLIHISRYVLSSVSPALS